MSTFLTSNNLDQGLSKFVPPFPTTNYFQNQNVDSSPFQTLRRPSQFRPFSVNNQIQESTYGSFMYKQEPIYGYAIVQKPYLVPIGSTSVYMSCYTTIGNEPHYYVNGDFLAEKLRLEEENEEVFLT